MVNLVNFGWEQKVRFSSIFLDFPRFGKIFRDLVRFGKIFRDFFLNFACTDAGKKNIINRGQMHLNNVREKRLEEN